MYSLKSHLRRIILAKSARADVDIQALIEKTHRDARQKVFRTTSSGTTTPAEKPVASDKNESRQSQEAPVCRLQNGGQFRKVIDSDSEDSVIGTTTRRQAIRETATSQKSYDSVELRLYRKTNPTRPDPNGPVLPYGPCFLTSDCITSHDCFARICEEIGTDCSFMIFRLPEDMSHESSIRIDRGSGNSEVLFQRVLDIFGRRRDSRVSHSTTQSKWKLASTCLSTIETEWKCCRSESFRWYSMAMRDRQWAVKRGCDGFREWRIPTNVTNVSHYLVIWVRRPVLRFNS
jgi:hypothetical protein